MIEATKIYACFATEVYDDFGDCDSYQEYYRKEHVEKELRAIKHALWMARAMRAEGMLRFFALALNMEQCKKWEWVEYKCLAKAKEFE